MRSHNEEHSDTLPVMDISALKHVAYVLDALIYYMQSGTDSDADMIKDGISVNSWQDHDENDNEVCRFCFVQSVHRFSVSFCVFLKYIKKDKLTNDYFFQEQEDDAVNQAVAMETDSMDGDSDTESKTGRRHPFFHR